MGDFGIAGRRLHLRLFLEGIEMPIISASVQMALNSPATCSIQVVPSDAVLELKPRTLVHVFYWDEYQDQEERPPPPGKPLTADEKEAQEFASESIFDSGLDRDKIKKAQAKTAPVQASAVPQISENPLRGYKLLFGGEVVGVAVGKTPMSRQTVLQCLDWSSYWDTCYQMMISWGPNGNFLTEHSNMWAGGSNLFDDILNSHSAVLHGLLENGAKHGPKTDGLQGVRGLAGGIIRVLEAMGGVPNHTKGVNDFFAVGELMRHLTQQITAEPSDDTALKLFSNKAFWAWLDRGGASLGELVTFRDLMRLFFQWVYYEVVPVSCPMYVPARPPVLRQKARTFNVTVSSGAANTLNGARDFAERRVLAAQKKDSLGLFAVDVDGQEKILRSMRNGLLLSGAKKALQRAHVKVQNVQQRMANFKGEVGRERVLTGLGGQSTTEDAAHPSTEWGYFQRQWEGVVKDIEEALKASGETVRQGPKYNKRDLPRLQTQIFRPDCFFAAPPKCNVFFPDQYTQFSYQRSFLQEPTRLRLQTEWAFIGKDALLGTFHYAPSLKFIKENAQKQGQRSLRGLLPWEKYTGVLPKFESIHEVNFVANKVQRDLDKRLVWEGKSYSQRAANFNFFKYRFAARSAEVTARFSPQVAVGFPGLVIERPFVVDREQIEARLKAAGVEGVDLANQSIVDAIGVLGEALEAPTQYLGMIQSVSHTVDQGGGTTQASMSHARTHRLADDDFLDAFAKAVKDEINTETVATLYDVQRLLDAGDYQKLAYLVRLTSQDIEAQMVIMDAQEQQKKNALLEPDFPTDERPLYGPEPQKAKLQQLGAVISAGDAGLPKPVKSKTDKTTDGYRGMTREEQLRGTGTTILVPERAGKIKVGDKKGPNGGVIRQIQVLGDAVVKLVRAPHGGLSEVRKTVTVEKAWLINRSKAVVVKEKKRVPEFQKTERELFAWRQLVVYEDVKGKKKMRDLPIEEALRPPWFAPIYSNLFIGDHVYQPFFGCGSVVDESVFRIFDEFVVQGASDDPSITKKTINQKVEIVSSPTSGVKGERAIGPFNVTKATRKVSVNVQGPSRRQKLLEQVKGANGDPKEIAKVLEKFTGSLENLLSLPSIEQSVDILAYLYGETKRLGLDVHRFVADYTHRPIATLEDIFGSDDLEYAMKDGKLTRVKGTPGFHSTSVGDLEDLHGLADDPDKPLHHLYDGTGKSSPIDKSLDPRPDRRRQVLAYAEDLFAGRGSLGVGLLG